MTSERRILGPVAIHGEGNRVVALDLATLVTRLLLSQTYVLQSVQAAEPMLLSRAFDTSSLETLFQAGALKLYYDSFTVGQSGQIRAEMNFRGNNTRLPLCSYSFSEIRVPDEEVQFQANLKGLMPGLRQAMEASRIPTPPNFKESVFPQFFKNLLGDPAELEAAVRFDLRTRGLKPKRITLSVEQTDVEDYRVSNNLKSECDISEEMAHKVIERSLLAIVDLQVRFAQMQVCDAVSGIREKDLPLLRAKLGAAAKLVTPTNSETQFERVAKIAGLHVPVFGHTTVDAEKLLEVRGSDECRAFRDWLVDAGSLTDKQIRDRVRALNARMAQALNSTTGKTVRVFVSTGLGFVPHTLGLVGLGASILDTFVIDRVFRKDAVVAFLSELYPSVLHNK
jgi:hypothetical protein